MCGSGSGDLRLGRAGLWGAGDQPCCGTAGAGTDGPGGLNWGPKMGQDSEDWWCSQGHDTWDTGALLQTRYLLCS